MSKSLKIKAKKRKNLGKKIKLTREEGKVPAVIYGKGMDSLPLEVDTVEFDEVFEEAGHSTIIDVEIEKGKPEKVLIQEVQVDPVTSDYVHASFFKIDLKKDITAIVPVEITGDEESPAVKEDGGVIIQPIAEIEIRCKPLDLPSEITIDVSKCKVGDTLTVDDIDLPKGVRLVREEDSEMVLVTATMPKEEEEEEEPVEAVGEGLEAGEEGEEGVVVEGEEGRPGEGASAEGEEGKSAEGPLEPGAKPGAKPSPQGQPGQSAQPGRRAE